MNRNFTVEELKQVVREVVKEAVIEMNVKNMRAKDQRRVYYAKSELMEMYNLKGSMFDMIVNDPNLKVVSLAAGKHINSKKVYRLESFERALQILEQSS